MSFGDALNNHNEAVSTLAGMTADIETAARTLLESVQQGGTIYWLGNGGSAADAQHYAAELMVRYATDRKPISSIALTTDTSLLTAHSNDYGYDTVFARQVQGLVKPGDVVVGISTSGNSENVYLAMEQAKVNGAKTIAMLGKDGGRIQTLVDQPLVVSTPITAHIQEAHLVIGHYLCHFLEANIETSV